jgi:hypothetical protein
MHVVAYARLNINKGELDMHGVFFGGIAHSKEEANTLARACVNCTKTHMIIPKVLDIKAEENLVDVLYDAADKFENMFKYMQEASETISLSKKR